MVCRNVQSHILMLQLLSTVKDVPTTKFVITVLLQRVKTKHIQYARATGVSVLLGTVCNNLCKLIAL